MIEFSKNIDIKGNSSFDPTLDSPCIKCENVIIDKCRETVRTFNPDAYMSLSQNNKMMMIRDFHQGVENSMGVKTNLYFTKLAPNVRGSYSPLSKTIALNENQLNNPSQILTTVLHEMRHALQHEAVNAPHMFDIPNDTIESWRQNFEKYIKPEDNFPKYYCQPVEVDARTFAQLVMKSY